jgi:hypothetical protein
LADVDAARSKVYEPVNLVLLAPVSGSDVDVHPVLGDFVFWHLYERQRWWLGRRD